MGRNLERLLMVAACLMPLAVAAHHGIDRPFSDVPDADLIYLGQALRLADGLRQTYFDHTGYVYILLLEAWIRLASMLGAVPAPSQGAAIAAADIGAYLQPLTEAGRWLSIGLCAAFVAVFIRGLRALDAPGPVTAALGLVFAASAGLEFHAQVLRAELLSAMFVFAAFALLAGAASVSGWRNVAAMTAAGLAAMLAMETKVQAVIPLLGLPLAVQALDAPAPWLARRRLGEAESVFLLAAAVVMVPVAAMAGFSLRDYGGRLMGYQFAIAAWLALALLAWGRLNRVPWPGQVLGIAGLGAGMAAGVGLLLVWHAPQNLDAMVNFVEHMLIFAQDVGDAGRFVAPFLGHRLAALATPTGLLEIAAIVGALAMARRGEVRRAVLVVFLVGLAWAIEAGFTLRGAHVRYDAYASVWTLAAAALAARFVWSRAGRRGRAAVMAALLAAAAWNLGGALSPELLPDQPRDNVCRQAAYYLEPAFAARFGAYCDGSQNP